MLYSKNGSIPYPETDGTDGWIEVEDAPDAPEGKEVVWWYPPGWVVRDLAPGQNFAWNQDQQKWIEIVTVVETTNATVSALTSDQVSSLSSDQISGLSTAQIGV